MPEGQFSRTDLVCEVLVRLPDELLKSGLTGREIYQYAEKLELLKNLRTPLPSHNPGNTIQTSIDSEIYYQGEESRFRTVGTNRPRKYTLSSFRIQASNDRRSGSPGVMILPPPESEIVKKGEVWLEKHLHAYVSTYAALELKASTATIFQTTKSTGGVKEQWRYPDMIGVASKTRDFDQRVRRLFKHTESNPYTFYSFEIKRRLDSSNLRDSYFQAVSNSSWAHEGYLLAGAVEEDTHFRNELKRLNQSYGIGVIQLLSSSELEQGRMQYDPELLYVAKRREDLDWEPLSYLCDVNSDFSAALSLFDLSQTDEQHSAVLTENYWDKTYVNQEEKLTIDLNSPGAPTELEALEKSIQDRLVKRRVYSKKS